MGRYPSCWSCSKHEEGVNRGAWTPSEDKILSEYIKTHGVHRWKSLAKKAGLKRCGKSCRFRWLNYLRPDIKRGNISPEEDELIVRLHRLLGNRWALIAGRLPGRTDNELKNYWNTQLGKRVQVGEFESKFQNSLKRKNVPSYSSYDEERLVEKENYSSETLPLKPTAVRYCGRAVVDAANLENYNFDHVPDTHDVINQVANDHAVEIDTSKSWCQLLLEDCMGDCQYDRFEAIDGLQYDIIMSTSNRTDYFHQPASPFSSRSIIIQENHELQDFKDFNSSYIDSFLDLGIPSFLRP